ENWQGDFQYEEYDANYDGEGNYQEEDCRYDQENYQGYYNNNDQDLGENFDENAQEELFDSNFGQYTGPNGSARGQNCGPNGSVRGRCYGPNGSVRVHGDRHGSYQDQNDEPQCSSWS